MVRITWSSMKAARPAGNAVDPILVRTKAKSSDTVWDYTCAFYFRNINYPNGAIFINSKAKDWIEFANSFDIIEYMELSQLEQDGIERFTYSK